MSRGGVWGTTVGRGASREKEIKFFCGKHFRGKGVGVERLKKRGCQPRKKFPRGGRMGV